MRKINLIIDTDTANEVDDQFALAYALTSGKFNIQALTISPFVVSFSRITPKESVIESKNEANRILRLVGIKDNNLVVRGCTSFFDDGTPENNDAVDRIIEIAHQNKHTVIAVLGVLTNIALAIIKDPTIITKIEIVWLGTKFLFAETFNDSNYRKDKKAFEIVMKSDVKMTVIPSYIGKFFTTSVYELENTITNNDIGKYLCSIVKELDKKLNCGGLKCIYDISPIAYLIDPKKFYTTILDRDVFFKEQEKLGNGAVLNYVYDTEANNMVWRDFVKTISNFDANNKPVQYFFISDTHFSQERKIRLKTVPYHTVEEMDADMIKKWNSVTERKDIIYHLGDFGNYDIVKKLKGNIILICGNYEETDMKENFEIFREKLIKKGFKDVVRKGVILDKEILGQEVYLTHKPSNRDKDKFTIFGHVHTLTPIKPWGFNVCCSYHNFKPVSVKEMKRYINFVKNNADIDVLGE